MDYSREAALFTKDLINHVFKKHGLNYAPTKNHLERIGESPFRLVMGEAVCFGIDQNVHQLYLMFQEQFNATLDATSFREHTIELIPDWFPEGYHPICFIEFCAMILSTAISFHKAGCPEIPSCVEEVIASVLTQHILKGEFKKKGEWLKLVKVSTELVISQKQKNFEYRK